MVERDASIAESESTGAPPWDPSQAAALWRAITRGNLSEAQRLLLALPAGAATTFNFDDISVITEAELPGTSPLGSPTAQAWGSGNLVCLFLFDPALHCGGIFNATRYRSSPSCKVCAMTRTGLSACSSISHQREGDKFVLSEPSWMIKFPTASQAAAQKPAVFSRPHIPTSSFPENFGMYGAFETLTRLEAKAGQWLTAIEALPARDILEGYVDFQPGAPDPMESVDEATIEEQDLLDQDATTLEYALTMITHLSEEVRQLKADLDIAQNDVADVQDACDRMALAGGTGGNDGPRVRTDLSGDATRILLERAEAKAREAASLQVSAFEARSLTGSRAQIANVNAVQLSLGGHASRLTVLEKDMHGPEGRVESIVNTCKMIEARADKASFEIGGEVFRSELDVEAFIRPLAVRELYRLVADFNVLLHLIPDPFVDFEGAMAVENARTKANYGSVLAARVMVSHQIRYPPLVLRATSGSDSDTVTYRFAPGFKTLRVFEGTHNSGTKYEITNNLQTIKAQHSKSIRKVFPPDKRPKAYGVLMDALNLACDQVKEWVDSIGAFNASLVAGGLSDTQAWESVLVYIKRFFDDVYEVRSTAGEVNDEAAVIWGSFCGHCKIEEYRSFNFVEHPAVGAMLVLTVLEHEDDGSASAREALVEVAELKKAMTAVKQNVGNLQADVKVLKKG